LARLKRRVLERLMRYYRLLTELIARGPIETITSARIAKDLDVDPTQVRKDLNEIGVLGMGRVGYDICEVCRAIRFSLGFDQPYEAVLLGAGHLGGALLAYSGFARYGLHIVAAFDSDDRRVGEKISSCTIKSIRTMKPFIKKHEIRVAVLATPVDVSQKLTDRLVSVGVKAIWNFTPTRLIAPPDVLVRNEHISLGLCEIAHHLRKPKREKNLEIA